MLETYFSASKMRAHLRSGPSGPYLDGFAAGLERQGYSADTAVRYLRAAAHLGHVVARQGAMPSEIDLAAFSKHLRSCRCARALGGRRNHHTIFGARLFRRHLVEIGVCQSRRRAFATSRAAPRDALQRMAAQAPRGVRRHDQTLRPRRRALDGSARGRSRKVGAGRHSQLLPGLREPLRRGNGREADDQPACVLALPCCRRPLPGRSRRCRSRPMPVGGSPTCRDIWRRSR